MTVGQLRRINLPCDERKRKVQIKAEEPWVLRPVCCMFVSVLGMTAVSVVQSHE